MRLSDRSQLAAAALLETTISTAQAASAIDSWTRRRTGTPSRSQIAAKTKPAITSAAAISTTSRRTSPCWN